MFPTTAASNADSADTESQAGPAAALAPQADIHAQAQPAGVLAQGQPPAEVPRLKRLFKLIKDWRGAEVLSVSINPKRRHALMYTCAPFPSRQAR